MRQLREQVAPEDEQALRVQISAHVARAVHGLLHTMAGSLRCSSRPARWPIVRNGTLDERLHDAVLFRIAVPTQLRREFLEMLGRELAFAARDGTIQGPYWHLRVNPAGEVHIELLAEDIPQPPGPVRERAKPVKMFFAKRAP